MDDQWCQLSLWSPGFVVVVVLAPTGEDPKIFLVKTAVFSWRREKTALSLVLSPPSSLFSLSSLSYKQPFRGGEHSWLRHFHWRWRHFDWFCRREREEWLEERKKPGFAASLSSFFSTCSSPCLGFCRDDAAWQEVVFSLVQVCAGETRSLSLSLLLLVLLTHFPLSSGCLFATYWTVSEGGKHEKHCLALFVSLFPSNCLSSLQREKRFSRLHLKRHWSVSCHHLLLHHPHHPSFSVHHPVSWSVIIFIFTSDSKEGDKDNVYSLREMRVRFKEQEAGNKTVIETTTTRPLSLIYKLDSQSNTCTSYHSSHCHHHTRL